LFDLVTFLVLLHLFQANESIFQTTWFVVSLLTELGVVLVLRTRQSAWRSSPSTVLLWASIAAAAAAIAVPYTGGAAAIFDFTPLPVPLITLAFFIVAAYLAATEIVKRHFFATQRRHAGGN
jgi:Mg2+-importing ATPase